MAEQSVSAKIDPPVDKPNPFHGAPQHLIDQRIAELEAQAFPLSPSQVKDLEQLKSAKPAEQPKAAKRV